MPFLNFIGNCPPAGEAGKFQKGFTLIEILAVLGILSVTVASTMLFLNSVFRASNQANVTTELKQNGQAVLDSLEREIRNSSATVSHKTGDAGSPSSDLPTNATNHLRLERADGTLFNVACFKPPSDPGEHNGWIGISNDNPTSDLQYQSLTNKDEVNGVDTSSCSLFIDKASEGGVEPAVVNIEFVINQGVKSPSRKDFLANVRFKTAISLRK